MPSIAQAVPDDAHIGAAARMVQRADRVRDQWMTAVGAGRLGFIGGIERQVVTLRAPHDIQRSDPVEQPEVDGRRRGGRQHGDDCDGEYLFSRHCHEWICNAQVQIRSGGDITGDEKTEKFK